MQHFMFEENYEKKINKWTGMAEVRKAKSIHEWYLTYSRYKRGNLDRWDLSFPSLYTGMHGSGTLHASTAPPKPPLRAPRRVVNAEVIDSIKEWTSLPMSELLTFASGRKD